ncbi:hypothetical protein [Marivita geojedonensis]|uniref:Uncharacterized protein n=1 Tax=Marivita geojedonensis TaxID=1123756 RepID=A0A1X4NPE6_9RHOB|nr:hypothetical protein [Marivita geojedonensis]OSQ52436.1 hypothetical protein MGEO_03365 [Marivita geojedonensis]PRY73740.1 hypothetical protein CLV76_12913 [Marivita geojedonensis]
MIEFRQLSDDHPELAYSPLLRAASLTLQHVEDYGAIGLTQTKAFKRTFVKWAAEHFDWPGMSADELLRYNKVLNEYDFPPLELLHFLLVELKLGRHYKGAFRLTKRGKEIAKHPARLLDTLVPFYVLNVDHSSYGRFDEQPLGNWDVWMNVINVEIDHGASEEDLFRAFYGDDANSDVGTWRERSVFKSFVLRPLEWSGLIFSQDTERDGQRERHYFKSPLWRQVLVLDTDDLLNPLSVQ